MGSYRLTCQMEVALPLSVVFAVFEDPRNLARITPPWLRFRIREPGPLAMAIDLRIRYTIRWLGIPLPWRTRIAEYQPGQYFVDEQELGPYRWWRHTHTFEVCQGGVLVTDTVDYALPLGPLGQLAHALLVKHQLLDIFRYRQRALASLFDNRSRERIAPTIERVQ